MAKINEERDEALRILLRGAMVVKHVSTKKLRGMIASPMCAETLRGKLKTPTTLKVCELREVCDALGIPEGAWKGVI